MVEAYAVGGGEQRDETEEVNAVVLVRVEVNGVEKGGWKEGAGFVLPYFANEGAGHQVEDPSCVAVVGTGEVGEDIVDELRGKLASRPTPLKVGGAGAFFLSQIPPPHLTEMTTSNKKSVDRTVRVVFIALLLDILAFTIILPLFPRLLQYYKDTDVGDETTLFNVVLAQINQFKRSLSRESVVSNAKWDLVLMGGAMGSLFSFLQFITAPVIGQMSDQLGRRRTLLITMMGNILSTLTWAFANTFSLFVLSRVIGGLSEGNVQLSIAIISDITTKETRSWGLALVGIAFAISFTFGPSLGAYFASLDLSGSFPSLVAWGLNPFSAPAMLALTLLTIETLYLWLFLPETNAAIPSDKTHTLPVSHVKRPPSLSPSVTSPAQIRLANLTLLSYAHLAHLFVFSGMEFTLIFLTFDVFDFGNMQQGSLLGYIGILSSLLQGGYVRRHAHRIGEKRLVVQGVVACATGLAIIALMVAIGGGISWLYAGATCLAVTSATVVNCLTSLASMQCDAEEEQEGAKQGGGETETDPRLLRGRALGRFRGMGQLGRSLGPVVSCSFYWFAGPAWCYGVGALGMVVVAVGVIGWVPSSQSGGEEAEKGIKGA
ncbi:major facilitator superfamily domain-containing protein [Jimgerdemannia flammicorona]|uniref:Major facilitator superfamily domain-containing protein n=1 Tax=Jimgerdemannia flammicorona TaxID=994334 RepID=A0A433DG61_9FUNG|nr:major facilitator superfamily domain-containing protein [Jimgerdemannia flammicorona]